MAAGFAVGGQDSWGRWRRALALVAKILGVGGGAFWGRSDGMGQTYPATAAAVPIRGVGPRPFVGPTPFVPGTYPRNAGDLPHEDLLTQQSQLSGVRRAYSSSERGVSVDG